MQVLLLAAGMGRRLGELANGETKTMLEVNGVKLLDRLIANLDGFDISRIILVLGYNAKSVKEYVQSQDYGWEIVFVENKDYAKTNNIFSLNLAADLLTQDDTLLIESDLIFEKSVLEQIINHPYPNLALVAKYESWMDGTIVKLDKNNNIISLLGKKHFDYSQINDYYKTVNIYKFSKEFSANVYLPFLQAYITVFGENEYYEQVLRVLTLLENIDLKALPLNGQKWYEIDDIQDYDIASSLFEEDDSKFWKARTFRYGGYWRYPGMLDYCYLVNPYFPSPTLLAEFKSCFDTLLTQYPSGMNVNSKLVARFFDINSMYAVAGNGAAELIKAYMEKYVGKLGLCFPTFEEYPNRLKENDIVKFIPSNPDFSYTIDDIMTYFSNKSIDHLLLINPDNPSGNFIKRAELISLIEWAEKKKIKIIVDESFVDFVDTENEFTLLLNNVLEQYENLIVVKSISKSYGVPGLRLGVLASGDTELIGGLKKDVSIWNINSFAEFFMQIFIKYSKDYKKACELFKIEREIFKQELSQVKFLRVIPSQANYFMCELLTDRFTSRELAVKLLREHNILIKDCSEKASFNGKQYIRLAIRNREDNSRLTYILNLL